MICPQSLSRTMTADTVRDDLPPVGATVDALALRIGSAAADWNCYLHSTRGYDPVAPVQSVTDALETAATTLRALLAERDQLKVDLQGALESARDSGAAQDHMRKYGAEVREERDQLKATIEILSDEVRELRQKLANLETMEVGP